MRKVKPLTVSNQIIRSWIFGVWSFVCLAILRPPVYAETTPVRTIDYARHLVFLRSYQQDYNWYSPWNKTEISKRQGMALVLENHYLLTTAELVANNTLIEVKKITHPYPFRAEVVTLDYEINLALIRVEQAEFWKDLEPLMLGDLEIGEVAVVQRKGPNELEQIMGVAEKLSMGYRAVSRLPLPVLRVEASQAKEASGNVVVQQGKVVGMGLQIRQGGLDAIPSALLQKFVTSSHTQNYKGFARRGFLWSPIPQPSVSAYLKIDPMLPGILVTSPSHYGTGSEALRPKDFLYRIGEWDLSNEGFLNHPKWGQILIDYLFALHYQNGEIIDFHVIRNGEPKILKVEVSGFPAEKYFVPLETVSTAPQYVLQGGFLFQQLSMNYLQVWGSKWASSAPLRLRLFQQLDSLLKENKDRHVVLLTRVLPDTINMGYQDLQNMIVTQINEVKIDALEDVLEAFKQPKNGFHQIHFLPGHNRRHLIVPHQLLNEANERILNNFQIPQLQHLQSLPISG
ncbi:hypothetical protein WDW89_07645 [Deltaproteobacteria bacterium TL4]